PQDPDASWTLGPTRRRERGLASGFEGLLKAQNADQGRGYCLGAGCQRDPHGGTAVSLVEIQAGRERHAVLFEQRLTPRLGVRMWTQLATNAGVDIEGAVGRGNISPTKIIERSQHHRPRAV